MKRARNSRTCSSHKLPLSFLAIALLSVYASGSELIVHYSKQRIVIATDSLITTGSTASPTYSHECKIHHFGDAFWVSAGLGRNPAIKFDVNEVVIRSIKHNQTAEGTLRDFSREALYPLQKTLTLVKRGDPVRYKKLLKRRSMLSFCLIWRRSDGLSFLWQEFPIVNGKVIQGKPHQCSFDCTMTDGSSAVQTYVANNRDIWARMGAVPAIDFLMKMATDEEPESIGPPVSIIEITPTTLEWIRQNDCPAASN
jgi:hypothetical protein